MAQRVLAILDVLRHRHGAGSGKRENARHQRALVVVDQEGRGHASGGRRRVDTAHQPELQ